MSRYRNFCIVDFEALTWGDFKNRYKKSRFIAGAPEVCPTTKKPHFQGVVCYDNAKAIKTMGKKRKNDVQPMQGHILDATGYCAKGTREKPEGGYRVYLDDPCEGFHMEGDMPQQGARTDLEGACALLREGKTLQEIVETHAPVVAKYPRGLQLVKTLSIKPRDGTIVPEVRVFHGPTGTGKSHSARQWLPKAYIFSCHLDGWWEGYQGEQDVIFEEFRGGLPFSQMLELLDRWSAKVKIKGAYSEFCGTRIAITSPIPPEMWYPNKCSDQDSLNQLLRRITSIKFCTEVFCTEVTGNTEPSLLN